MENNISEQFVETFLEENKLINENDALLLLSNSIRYREELPEPVKGIRENVQLFTQRVKEEADKAVQSFCEEYCSESSDLAERIQQAGNVQGFILISKVLSELITPGGFIILSNLDNESLAALTLLINKMKPTFNELCNCEK